MALRLRRRWFSVVIGWAEEQGSALRSVEALGYRGHVLLIDIIIIPTHVLSRYSAVVVAALWRREQISALLAWS
jgi:hypothetical protein